MLVEVDALHTWGDVSFGANRVVAGWLLEHTPEDHRAIPSGRDALVHLRGSSSRGSPGNCESGSTC